MAVSMLDAVYTSRFMRGLTTAERVVYQYLVFRYNDKTGRCNIPIKTIADQCRFGDGNKRNVSRIINALVFKGYLTRQEFRYRNGIGYCYTPIVRGCQGDNPHTEMSAMSAMSAMSTAGVNVTTPRVSRQPPRVSRQPQSGVTVTPSIKERQSKTCERVGAAGAAALTPAQSFEIAVRVAVEWAADVLHVKSPPTLWAEYLHRYRDTEEFCGKVKDVLANGWTRGSAKRFNALLEAGL